LFDWGSGGGNVAESGPVPNLGTDWGEFSSSLLPRRKFGRWAGGGGRTQSRGQNKRGRGRNQRQAMEQD